MIREEIAVWACFHHYLGARNSAPYGGLLSSSSGGLQPSAAAEGPFGSKGDFARQTDRRTNRQKDGRTTELREAAP